MSEYILPLFVSNRYPSPRCIPIYHAFRTRNTMIFPFRLRFSLSLAVTDLSQAQRPCAGQRQTLNQQFFSPTTAITTRRTRNNIYIYRSGKFLARHQEILAHLLNFHPISGQLIENIDLKNVFSGHLFLLPPPGNVQFFFLYIEFK